MTLNVQAWPLDRLKPYERNSKKHDKAQVAKIAESIKQFGWDQPIVVDADGVIIKGHGRRLAAIELGLEKVPVLVRDDLTPEQVRAARLADNRVAISDIDTDLLRKELADLDFDLSNIFDKKELDFSAVDLGEMNEAAFIADIDAAVTAQDEKTKQKITDLEQKRIPLAKVFGFKDILGANEILFNRFMGHCEHVTGKTGEAALVEFIRSHLQLSQS